MSKPRLLSIFDETADEALSRLNNPVTVSKSGDTIVVDQSITVYDNAIITFKAPCSCESISYIKIGETLYTLVDAVGGSIAESEAFIQGASISVIMDIEGYRAFIMNSASGSSGGSGIAPADVTGVSVLTSHEKVYLKWSDPDDAIVSGTVLCKWAGTVLVRKAGSYPIGPSDGVVVLDNKERNAYSNSYFTDSGLTNGVTYYYQFFPYSNTKVYNKSESNRISATPNAVAPENVSGMSATASGNGKMTVCWTDPSATIVSDGVPLSTWANTKVVYKTGSYPTNPDDGILAVTSTTRNAYATNGLQISGLTNGTTYYVAFFPTSTDGAVNLSTSNRITGVPNRITVSVTPSQSGTLTYNGNSLSPTWSNYNSGQLTLGGTTSGTNAGTYSATFTPKDDYMWSNGSTDAKTVSWVINKAAGSSSINPTSMTLNLSATSGTISVTRSGNGTITATSSNTNVATVSVSGTTVTVKSVNNTNGSATITIKVAAGTNHTAPTDKTCTVTASFITNVLNDNDWDAIKSVNSSGSSYWAVGDRKAVAISGTVGSLSISGTYYCFILGFNHNSAREGNGIHFQFGKTALSGGTDICFIDSGYNNSKTSGTWFNMNNSNTNSGGWSSSGMRTVVCPAFLTALPSALQNVISACTKYTDNTGGGSNAAANVTSTSDKIWLLAEFEVHGTRSHANSTEQSYQAQYDYYKNGNSKIKYRHSSTSSTAYWWLRSAYYDNSIYFCYVNTDGGANVSSARHSRGFAPAFKI